MLNGIDDISQRRAAIVLGMALFAMLSLAFLIGEFVLSNLIHPGENAPLKRDIEADEMGFQTRFGFYAKLLNCQN